MTQVPKQDVGEFFAIAGRLEQFDWGIPVLDSSGSRAALNSGDKVRFKLAASPGSASPLIDIRNGTPASGGSNVTVTSLGSSSTNAVGVLELRRGDTASLDGRYFFEIDRDDSANNNLTSQPIRGTIVFKPSMGGSIGG